jgi:hypothetical protein
MDRRPAHPDRDLEIVQIGPGHAPEVTHEMTQTFEWRIPYAHGARAFRRPFFTPNSLGSTSEAGLALANIALVHSGFSEIMSGPRPILHHVRLIRTNSVISRIWSLASKVNEQYDSPAGSAATDMSRTNYRDAEQRCPRRRQHPSVCDAVRLPPQCHGMNVPTIT